MPKYLISIVAALLGRGAQFGANVFIARVIGVETFAAYSTGINTILAVYAGSTLGLPYALLRHTRYTRRGYVRQILVVGCYAVPILAIAAQLLGGKHVFSWDAEKQGVLAFLVLAYVHYSVLASSGYARQRYKTMAFIGNSAPVAVIITALCLYALGIEPNEMVLMGVFVCIPVGLAYTAGLTAEVDPSIISRIGWARAAKVYAVALRYSGTMSVTNFLIAAVPALCLIGSAATPSENQELAVALTAANVLMVVPNAVSNILISDRDHQRAKRVRPLVLLTGLSMVGLYVGGLDIVVAIVSDAVRLDAVQRLHVVSGTGGLALAKIILTDSLKAQREKLAVTVFTAALVGTLSSACLLGLAVHQMGLHDWFAFYAAAGGGICIGGFAARIASHGGRTAIAARMGMAGERQLQGD